MHASERHTVQPRSHGHSSHIFELLFGDACIAPCSAVWQGTLAAPVLVLGILGLAAARKGTGVYSNGWAEELILLQGYFASERRLMSQMRVSEQRNRPPSVRVRTGDSS